MNWNQWCRQIHRWLSIAFTLTVVANVAAMTRGQPPAWVTYSPLPPLFLLMFTGLWMFLRPAGHRVARSTDPAAGRGEAGDSMRKASKGEGFTGEERAAIKERAQELKAEARANQDRAEGERAVLAKIGALVQKAVRPETRI